MKALGGFVLVGGVLLAAGAAWWLGLGGGSNQDMNAQAAVQNACAAEESSLSYDVTTTITSPFSSDPDAPLRQGRIDVRVSGEDFHIIADYLDWVGEFIKVDGSMYSRSGTSKGQGTWARMMWPK